MAMFAKNEEAQKLCTKYVDTLDTDYQGDGNWLMVWNEIKWYESYPDVGPVVAFIEAMSCDDLTEYGMNNGESLPDAEQHETLDAFYSFCRIGEDCEDVERMGHAFDDIAVQRSISY
jgi:hypothetical protein